MIICFLSTENKITTNTENKITTKFSGCEFVFDTKDLTCNKNFNTFKITNESAKINRSQLESIKPTLLNITFGFFFKNINIKLILNLVFICFIIIFIVNLIIFGTILSFNNNTLNKNMFVMDSYDLREKNKFIKYITYIKYYLRYAFDFFFRAINTINDESEKENKFISHILYYIVKDITMLICLICFILLLINRIQYQIKTTKTIYKNIFDFLSNCVNLTQDISIDEFTRLITFLETNCLEINKIIFIYLFFILFTIIYINCISKELWNNYYPLFLLRIAIYIKYINNINNILTVIIEAFQNILTNNKQCLTVHNDYNKTYNIDIINNLSILSIVLIILFIVFFIIVAKYILGLTIINNVKNNKIKSLIINYGSYHSLDVQDSLIKKSLNAKNSNIFLQSINILNLLFIVFLFIIFVLFMIFIINNANIFSIIFNDIYKFIILLMYLIIIPILFCKSYGIYDNIHNQLYKLYSFSFTKRNMKILDITNKSITKFILDNTVIGYNSPIVKCTATVGVGQTYIVSGPSGNGKSSFLFTLLSLIPPLEGNVKVVLEDNTIMFVDNISRRNLISKVGYCPQFSSFKNVLLRDLILTKNNLTEQQGEWLLKSFEMDKWFQSLPNGWNTYLSDSSQISGGQLSRLSIISQLAMHLRNKKIDDDIDDIRYEYCFDPFILIIDETLDNIDLKTKLQIIKMLTFYVAKNQLGIVCITHDINAFKDIQYTSILFSGGEAKYLQSFYSDVTFNMKNINESYILFLIKKNLK